MVTTLNDPHVAELVRRLCEIHRNAKSGGNVRVLVHYDEPAVQGICLQSDLFDAFGLLRSLKLLKVVDTQCLPGTFEINSRIEQAAKTVGLSNNPVASSEHVSLFERDMAPLVYGRTKKGLLTSAQYDVVKALIEAGAEGLTKDQLLTKSGRGDPRGILRRLADKDRDWKRAIRFAGKTGGRYRVR